MGIASMPDVANSVLQRIRPDVRAMQAYQVQDAGRLIKLDAMENPYPLPPELQLQLASRLGAVALHRYPGARVLDLLAALRTYAELPAGHSLMLGNGSDELISLLALACAVPGQKAVMLAPEPSFVMYGISARLQGMDYVGVPLTAEFALDLPAMLQAIQQHRPALVLLAYPNNPSANLWSPKDMQAVIDAARSCASLVVIDEAYQPFAGASYQPQLAQQPHLLLLRTLSKFGLAGVRLGYLIGRQDLIAQLDKVRPPYNVSSLNCEAALFALEQRAVFEQQAKDICAQREWLLQVLRAWPGVQVFDSQANMILLRVAQAQKTFDGLKARGVLVKNVSKMHPLLHNCLRITVGSQTENQQLLTALEASL